MKIDRDKPLPEHTKLDYYECYAKIIIEDLFPERYGSLLISDKPDLQNNDKSIGVEVTSADPSEQREAFRLWYTMPYVNAEKQKLNKERMRQLGTEYEGGIQSWPTRVYSDSEIDGYPIEYFIKAVENKVAKLNSGNYKEFKSYDLFVHADIYVSKSLLPEVLRNITDKNNGFKKYAKIYLFAQEKFICFDMQAGIFDIFNLDEKQYSYAVEAREMVIQGEEDY